MGTSSFAHEQPQEPWALKKAGLLIFLGIIFTTAGAFTAVFVAPRFAPHNLHGKERADVQNSIRDTGIKVTAGLAAAFAAVLTWGRLELSRLEHRLAEKRHLNEISGQITDRYTRAVDQLGSGDPAVRLGGLYALERIALDSERDRATACEELSAYVRYRTGLEVPDIPAGQKLNKQQEGNSAGEAQRRQQPALLVDVRTAISILVKHQSIWGVALNLISANLSGAYLADENLTGARLITANLTKAHLDGTNLSMATLAGSDLTAADLTDADLTETRPRWTNLSLVKFTRANLTGADLTGANLTGANLTGANLQRTLLTDADLTDSEGLTQEQVDSTIGAGAAKLPLGVVPRRGPTLGSR